MNKYPLIMLPAFKDYLWGGVKLKEKWGKDCQALPLAESWEVSLHSDALSRVANGKYKGYSLHEVLEFNPYFAGKNCLSFQRFPLLIKLIDAMQNLSVQVHPSDAYAIVHENSFGKAEVWFILEADEGAGIYFGFKKRVDEAEVRARIEDNTLTDVLNFIPVKSGDVFMIQPGIVHAIGAGITLAEIQQNSNLTYRVYDFGRLDKDGSPRELHIQKALEVMNFKPTKAEASKNLYVDFSHFSKKLIADNKYFYTEHYKVAERCVLEYEDCFIALTFTHGEAGIEYMDSSGKQYFSESVKKGMTAWIPAGLEVKVVGECEFILTTLR